MAAPPERVCPKERTVINPDLNKISLWIDAPTILVLYNPTQGVISEEEVFEVKQSGYYYFERPDGYGHSSWEHKDISGGSLREAGEVGNTHSEARESAASPTNTT